MKSFKLFLTVSVLSLSLGGCSLWPYKSEFTCPVPKGRMCQSLYEVNKQADSGVFDPLPEGQEAGKICEGALC